MDRRRFLALVGSSGGVGAAALFTSQAVAGVPTPPIEPAASDDTDAPRIEEQPDAPNRGTHRVIWGIDTTEPLVSLTFDDGPDPEFTPTVLDILARYDVRSTFFMMGWNARQHPDLARSVVEAGHEVGNHTLTHQNLAFTDPKQTREEIHQGAAAIEEVTGVRPRWFRPPRGQLSGFSVRHAAALRADTIIWSVTRGVPGAGTPAEVRDHVGAELSPGDIVDLHDGLGRGTFNPGRQFTEDLRARRNVELEALPGIIEDALDRGLRFGTIADLVAAEHRGMAADGPVHPDDVPDFADEAGE